jgi:ParB-like chromosome segregation protein Spo0J
MESDRPARFDDQPAVGAKSQDWLEFASEQWQVGEARIDQLLPAHSPRSAGEDHEHIRRLAESVTPLPPIVVHRPSMRVVDGMHRLRAAIMRGQSVITVRWYDGDERDVFAIAVQANVTHGLPLSLTDRRAAAIRLMWSHRHWSDRMVAEVVNLSPTTVRSIRTGVGCGAGTSDARLGRDGRVRPVNGAEARRLAGELLLAKPESSLREVARAAGLAPSTVLDVRRRLEAGEDPVPAKHRVQATPSRDGAKGISHSVDGGSENGDPADEIDLAAAIRRLCCDPALRYNNVGRMLLAWLHNGPIQPDERTSVANRLPAHCLDTITTVARSHATAWLQLVDELEARRCRLG